jgi:hypothetical protein
VKHYETLNPKRGENLNYLQYKFMDFDWEEYIFYIWILISGALSIIAIILLGLLNNFIGVPLGIIALIAWFSLPVLALIVRTADAVNEERKRYNNFKEYHPELFEKKPKQRKGRIK